METRRDILWRVYLCFLGIVVFSVVIIIRAVYIQEIEGPYWITQAKEQQQKEVEIDAQRGTIYSEDGRMLSTSIPYFDIYVDFAADGLREKEGQRFKQHLDSLARGLSALFKDRSIASYKRELQAGYNKKDRYYLLKKNISFQQYKILRTLPLVRLGKDKSGFIADVKDKRLNPFGLLANRTIGLSREYIDSNKIIRSTNVGLEKTYDSLLKGESGKRVMRKIAAGVYAPIDGSEIEPENGNDLVTTIDVNIQDIAENALYKVMDSNECTYGTCIVMEVATGKIKAIANLGRKPNGTYWEDLNYAIRASEPGSTFKLATLLSLLEDNYISLDQHVNLEGGKWMVNGRTVYDAEAHGLYDVTVKKAFEHSSNVGMAKLAMTYYSRKPEQYLDHIKKWRFNQYTGIDLLGETPPIVKNPKSRTWSATSLPWMAFGYEVLVSPLQTLMLYNAVANEGRMMKPYLVNSVQKNGLTIKENQPVVLEQSICSPASLKLVQECLEGVVKDSAGTAHKLFKGTLYPVAGKTGTALMANGSHGYGDHIYQSTFAGYFPADNPQYSCIVVIRNKPFAKKFYGAEIAGPVFKEISDKLYALNADKDKSIRQFTWKKDTTGYFYAGSSSDMKEVMNKLQWKYTDSTQKDEWSRLYAVNSEPVLNIRTVPENVIPDVKGMGLKDALYLLENRHVKVMAKGKGKVSVQSVAAGSPITGNQTITIELK